jgi:hypothetical protein
MSGEKANNYPGLRPIKGQQSGVSGNTTAQDQLSSPHTAIHVILTTVKTHITCGGTRWRSWLRHCTTSRKVAGSIHDGVIGIFH